MKVIVVENNYGEEAESGAEGWYLIADSAVSNTGKPFYLPEKIGRVTVDLGCAIRINRLGKSISPKFAPRYYSEFAPVLHFSLPDYRRQLEERGLSADASVSFDRSLFVGDFHPVADLEEITLYRDGERVAEWKPEGLKDSPDKVISQLSVMNTVKMGDLILPGLTGGIEIKEGDRLEVKVKGEDGFLVKVK